MLGIGQKKLSQYRVNGEDIHFSNSGPSYDVAISYWLHNGELIHKTKNDTLNIGDENISGPISFTKHIYGYRLGIEDIGTDVKLHEKDSKTDYVRFRAGITPFYRHNKYLSFTGTVNNQTVEKGIAFIQKVNLNMPFIPWRWGRVFFEDGSRFDFYEPRIIRSLYKSINFEHQEEKLEFKHNQRLEYDNGTWTIEGTATTGETLKARIKSYASIKQTFETTRSSFTYLEKPSILEDLTITLNDRILHSRKTLGESVANCEDAFYTQLTPWLPQYF